NQAFVLALRLERIPETSERTPMFRDIGQVERHVEPHAHVPMRTDDFSIRIIPGVEGQRGQDSYFQAGFGTLDVFAQFVIVAIIAAENPHVRVTIQPGYKYSPFDIPP